MSLKRKYAHLKQEQITSAYELLDYATSVFQSEMFDLAARGLHASACGFLDGRECTCYKMAIPKAVRQLILGRILSESQFEDYKDPNQQEFKSEI